MGNYLVAICILENRGACRGSIITGLSIHNCHVERTLRDVYNEILVFYTKLFENMETHWIHWISSLGLKMLPSSLSYQLLTKLQVFLERSSSDQGSFPLKFISRQPIAASLDNDESSPSRVKVDEAFMSFSWTSIGSVWLVF